MGLLSFFTQGDKTSIFVVDSDSKYELPLLSQETHNWAAEVTKFPVESGGVISDHVEVQPQKYTVTGIVADAPVNIYEFAKGIFSEKPTQLALDFFEHLIAARSQVTIDTKLKSYTSMVCTGIELSRSIGQKLVYSINFEQVSFAESSFTDATLAGAGAAAVSAKKKGAGAAAKNVGKKAPAPAAAAPAAKAGSIAASFFGLGGG